jgi:hypothetical protein
MLRLRTYRNESKLGKCHLDPTFGDFADLKMINNQQITSLIIENVWGRAQASTPMGDNDK